MSCNVSTPSLLGFSTPCTCLGSCTGIIRADACAMCTVSNHYDWMNNIDENLIVNMDETAVYFNTNHSYPINEKGARTVTVRHGCSKKNCCILCITITAYRAKLPLLVIFKGAINGMIANTFEETMPAGMYACTQVKFRWMRKWWNYGRRGLGSLSYNGTIILYCCWIKSSTTLMLILLIQ